MEITRDFIASVRGPDWKHGLSRILIDDEGNGAVFVVGSEIPFVEFTVVKLATQQGTGESPEGEIAWRRRGSSCAYKYAKCRLKTQQLKDWWMTSRELL